MLHHQRGEDFLPGYGDGELSLEIGGNLVHHRTVPVEPGDGADQKRREGLDPDPLRTGIQHIHAGDVHGFQNGEVVSGEGRMVGDPLLHQDMS